MTAFINALEDWAQFKTSHHTRLMGLNSGPITAGQLLLSLEAIKANSDAVSGRLTKGALKKQLKYTPAIYFTMGDQTYYCHYNENTKCLLIKRNRANGGIIFKIDISYGEATINELFEQLRERTEELKEKAFEEDLAKRRALKEAELSERKRLKATEKKAFANLISETIRSIDRKDKGVVIVAGNFRMVVKAKGGVEIEISKGERVTTYRPVFNG